MIYRKYSPAALMVGIALMLLVVGCGTQGSHTNSGEPVDIEAPRDQRPTPLTESIEEPTGIPTPEPEEMEWASGPIGDYEGPESLDERILSDNTVVRVRLLDTATAVEPFILSRPARHGYFSAVEFRFRALEYLKGTGPNEIVAVAVGNHYKTEAEARAALSGMAAERDTRWDNREAVVFLDDAAEHIPSIQQAGRYFLGGFYYWADWGDGYTVASEHYKEWFPSTAPSGGATGETGEQRFLLDAPPLGASGPSGQSADTPAITLSALKARITELEAEATEGGNSSQEYRDCVLQKYTAERRIRWQITTAGSAVQRHTHKLGSGLPAETVVWEDQYGIGLPPDNVGKFWLEGRDKDLFHFGGFDPVPTVLFSGNTPSTPPDAVFFTRRLSTTRPLPAGEYQFFVNGMSADRLLCNAYSELERNLSDTRVAATAPDGTLAESLFDPVAAGDAVSGDTTIGPIKWEAGQVEAALTLDVTGHKLDFIALDGTVTLSLDAADATKTGSVLSWPVAEKPWNAGDKLMLRVDTPTPSIGVSEITDTSALIVISNAPESAAFTWTQAPCAEVPAGEEEVQLSGLSPDEEYTATLYSDPSCQDRLDSVTFRTQVSAAPDATATPEGETP